MMMDPSSLYSSSRNFSNQYGNMRLDVDDMSYEELLAPGERIGNVNTGLSEDVISKCLRETKIYSNRSHEEGTLHLSYKKCNRLIVPVIAAGLGVLTHTLDTLVLVIGASGFATTAAATTIGTVVGGFR
ncbi:E3 ubiquitin-protein ligase MBR1-like isoform X1 [Camellia sinensis]|uniref:E3 ubiquitin-protein ligase MBR1-like isoform X1 n=2 Tax=Camellia sinensis TaxID=4442 RepID=UPI001035E5E8|nr:E3 ubiquitin-protein ligase MBR1-like isoform X1 [Camellia sinensis]